MEIVKVTAILDSVSTRKDGSIKLVFETQEVREEQFTALFKMKHEFGALFFCPAGKTPELLEAPKVEEKPFKEARSCSQRLRSVLYVYWKHLGSHGNFDHFYTTSMERFIDIVKERMDAPKV